jgi:hypothetical protein
MRRARKEEESMLRLRIVQAAKGDCLILQYGSPAGPRYMLIDGGPKDIYRDHLSGELRRIRGEGGKLDQVVLSHIDDDHAHGLVDLLDDLDGQRAGGQEPSIQIGELWHNTFSQMAGAQTAAALGARLYPETPGANEPGAANLGAATRAASPGPTVGRERKQASGEAGRVAAAFPDTFLLEPPSRGFEQGDRLTRLAKDLGIRVNPEFASAPEGMICVDYVRGPLRFGDLTIHIAGPTQANLAELQQRWQAWLAKPPSRALDTSFTNLSSIMFLAKAGGKKILFTGDGRGDELVDGLRQARLLDQGDTIHVDVLKMPHHGSIRNAPAGFFRSVTADRYVISADGENDNPDVSTLVALAETARADGRKIEIWITNETDGTREFRKTHPPEEYGYRWVSLPEGEHVLVLGLDAAS